LPGRDIEQKKWYSVRCKRRPRESLDGSGVELSRVDELVALELAIKDIGNRSEIGEPAGAHRVPIDAGAAQFADRCRERAREPGEVDDSRKLRKTVFRLYLECRTCRDSLNA